MTRRFEQFFADTKSKRRILALDGGGVRGLITLGILGELERELKRRSGDNNYRLSQYFDLIGGTSTGSIIATGLAHGWTVDDVKTAYLTIIPKVFGRKRAFGLLEPAYDEYPLAEALKRFFGDDPLESVDLETGLAIFAKRADTGSAWVLCNNPRWYYYDRKQPGVGYESNSGFKLRSLVQASAAAPHYFRRVQIHIEHARENVPPGEFIDGGVAGFNNPAMELLSLVRDPAFGFEWDLGQDQIYLLSLGTGWLRERNVGGRLFVSRTISALRSMLNDVSLQQIAYLQGMSRVALRWYINSEKEYQEDKSYLAPPGAPLLTYQRVDVRLGDDKNRAGQFLPETARELRGKPLSKTELKRASLITNKHRKNLDLLLDLGEKAGARFISLAPPPDSFNPDPWTRQGPIGPGGKREPRG